MRGEISRETGIACGRPVQDKVRRDEGERRREFSSPDEVRRRLFSRREIREKRVYKGGVERERERGEKWRTIELPIADWAVDWGHGTYGAVCVVKFKIRFSRLRDHVRF